MTQVKDLADVVAKDGSVFQNVFLEQCAVVERDEDLFFALKDDAELRLDEPALKTFGKFIEFPGTALTKLNTQLRKDVVSWLIDQNEGTKACFEHENGKLHAVYHSSEHIVPRTEYIGVVEDVFPGEAEVRYLDYGRGKVVVDVSTGSITTEPRVGDITEGGLRVTGYVEPRDYQPTVETYFHRLWCANGATNMEKGSLIKVRGVSVEELVQKMKDEANRILEEIVPTRVNQFGHLVEVDVPHPEQFVMRYAHEVGLGARVRDRIIETIPKLPDNERTMYDIANHITAMQHEEGITPRQVMLLQELGGRIVADEHHRCSTCHQTIKSARVTSEPVDPTQN